MAYQREFDKRMDVALVGVGSHAYRNILPALHHLPVRLTALCDINIELARKTAPEFGVTRCYGTIDELLSAEKLDGVLLCVGPGQHPALARKALDAGVHVWMEKPPGIRAAEIDDLLTHRNGKAVVVGFKKAHMPATRKARELFCGGPYGPIRSILGVYPITIPDDGAGRLERREWHGWLANGCHPLSFLLAVGGPVAAVSTFRGAREGGAVVLEFASGAIGNLHMAAGASTSRPVEHYAVFGESCHFTIDNVTRVSLHRAIPFAYGKTTTFAPEGTDTGTVTWEPQNLLGTLENQSAFTQGTYHELKAFVDQAMGVTPVATDAGDPASLEFASHLMHVYEAALASDGRRVAVGGQ